VTLIKDGATAADPALDPLFISAISPSQVRHLCCAVWSNLVWCIKSLADGRGTGCGAGTHGVRLAIGTLAVITKLTESPVSLEPKPSHHRRRHPLFDGIDVTPPLTREHDRILSSIYLFFSQPSRDCFNEYDDDGQTQHE